MGFRRQVELDYFLGFIRSARFRFSTNEKLLAALRELLEHPGARFLQTLHIDPLPNRELDHKKIEEVLCAAKGLTTLRRVDIDRPGSWNVPESLHDRFPKLRNDDAEGWTQVMKEASDKGKRLKVAIDASALPQLVARDRDSDIDVDPSLILRGLRVEVDKQRPFGIVEAMRQVFTPDSLDRFARALMDVWIESGERAADKWAYQCAGVFGGRECAERIGGLLSSWTHVRVVQGIGHLRLIARNVGGLSAIHEIIALAITPSRYYPRRQAAIETLLAIGREGNMTFDELLVRSCPRAVSESA